MDLEDLFRSHQRDVYTYFLRLAREPSRAEELAQETFVRACTAALRYRGASSVKTWLFGIAHKVWLEELRRGPRTVELVEQPAPVLDHEARMDVRAAFSTLESGDREVLLMADVVGLSAAEAASLLAISEEAFRVRVHRARKRLKERVNNG